MDWSCGRDVAQTAELLTSELVSNAVLHAQGSFELSVCGEEGEAIRIEVVDESPLRPVLAPPDGDVIAGRGLWLVDALAEEWGVEPSGHGKAVWFRLAR
jgi:anti-sigma regulatory factor (Ser/Thr protein kinase)